MNEDPNLLTKGRGPWPGKGGGTPRERLSERGRGGGPGGV